MYRSRCDDGEFEWHYKTSGKRDGKRENNSRNSKQKHQCSHVAQWKGREKSVRRHVLMRTSEWAIGVRCARAYVRTNIINIYRAEGKKSEYSKCFVEHNSIHCHCVTEQFKRNKIIHTRWLCVLYTLFSNVCAHTHTHAQAHSHTS